MTPESREEHVAKQIAWAHWRVLHPHDVSKTPDELWDNLRTTREAYIAGAKAALHTILESE